MRHVVGFNALDTGDVRSLFGDIRTIIGLTREYCKGEAEFEVVISPAEGGVRVVYLVAEGKHLIQTTLWPPKGTGAVEWGELLAESTALFLSLSGPYLAYHSDKKAGRNGQVVKVKKL